VIRITLVRYVHSECKTDRILDFTKLPVYSRYVCKFGSVSAGFHKFEKILALYIDIKIVTISRNHFCRGVAVSIKY